MLCNVTIIFHTLQDVCMPAVVTNFMPAVACSYVATERIPHAYYIMPNATGGDLTVLSTM